MPHIIEIGSLCEEVELLEAPHGGSRPRIGRIKHANGENAEVDFDTLQWLLLRANATRVSATQVSETGGSAVPSETTPVDSRGIATCSCFFA